MIKGVVRHGRTLCKRDATGRPALARLCWKTVVMALGWWSNLCDGCVCLGDHPSVPMDAR